MLIQHCKSLLLLHNAVQLASSVVILSWFLYSLPLYCRLISELLILLALCVPWETHRLSVAFLHIHRMPARTVWVKLYWHPLSVVTVAINCVHMIMVKISLSLPQKCGLSSLKTCACTMVLSVMFYLFKKT